MTTVTEKDLEANGLIKCWCGVIGTPEELFLDDFSGGCGGLGSIPCECGGDLCVCHNHGSIECFGCEDCEGFDDADDAYYD